MIGVYVTGLNECIQFLKEMEKEIPGIVKQTMEEGGNAALQEAIRLCPEDTGELVDSIYMEADENGFELGATAKHAVFNEYGCYNIVVPSNAKYKGQRPFIRPAIIKVANEIPSRFSKNWKSTLHG
jgi:hypothetical protein